MAEQDEVYTGWDNPGVGKSKRTILVSDYVAPYDDDRVAEEELDDEMDVEVEEGLEGESEEMAKIRSRDRPIRSDLNLEGREKEVTSIVEQLIKERNEEPLSDEQLGDINLITRHSSKRPVYGVDFDESLEEDLQDSSGGLIWRAKIYRNGYFSPKNRAFLKDKSLKPRRPIPVVFEDEFFSSLTFYKGKWIFQGKLNGWPALTNLELVSLQYWYSKNAGPKSVTFSRTFWSAKGSKKEDAPKYPVPGVFMFTKKPMCIRATLRSPKYSDVGYSKDNPGYVFWFRPFRPASIGGPKLAHGRQIIDALNHDSEVTKRPVERAVRAHFYAHRYAKKKESPKDRITYHTGVLIEWDHGEYCTNMELAYLFGVGGYGGKANWVEDKDSGNPVLFQCMPDSLKAPWRSNRSEIRIMDMNVKNLDEFKGFFKKYDGPSGRFMKSMIKYSGDVRLSMNSSTDITQFLVNYSARETAYSEEFRNCQTFAADFYSFLVAKTNVEPLYPIKLFYKERRHLFLYNYDQFQKKKKKKVKNENLILADTSGSKDGNANPAKKLYQKIFG